MLDYMKKGIVVHHGSLPLQARLILEHFTQQGFCRICFATSTLEQGINMPFDVVYLNTFRESNTLSMKNLIGRAGRSTPFNKFDYGSIVVKLENMSAFRSVMAQDEQLKTISLLDTADDEDAEYNDFKEAIKVQLMVITVIDTGNRLVRHGRAIRSIEQTIQEIPYHLYRQAAFQAVCAAWTYLRPYPGKRTDLPKCQKRCKAHTALADLGVAPHFLWKQGNGELNSAHAPISYGNIPLLCVLSLWLARKP